MGPPTFAGRVRITRGDFKAPVLSTVNINNQNKLKYFVSLRVFSNTKNTIINHAKEENSEFFTNIFLTSVIYNQHHVTIRKSATP